MNTTKPADVVVIGAGLIGLATGMELLARHPQLQVTVVEKDAHPASQQSGHNSGVIHSGIYYKPGSFKARFSVEGRRSIIKFCEDNDIATLRCGKLIVATEEDEIPRLEGLFDRGRANGVEPLELVEPERAREIEPHVRAVRALWAPGTAIVDFGEVARAYAQVFTGRGGTTQFNTRVRSVRRIGGVTVLETDSDTISAGAIVNCAGLHADVVARMAGTRPSAHIIPFRGEYYTLRDSKKSLVKGLIYPVPDPHFPFLGVHLSQTMKGVVEAGPNAVLATRREGYTKRDFALEDVARMLGYPGFWRLIRREWRAGVQEFYRSFSKSQFVRSLQRLIPEIEANDLEPGGSGVRAQAVARDGTLIDDFLIEQSPHAIHVLNAPSPGATSSLVIGRHIALLAEKAFALA